jgi:hypothetical protein
MVGNPDVICLRPFAAQSFDPDRPDALEAF